MERSRDRRRPRVSQVVVAWERGEWGVVLGSVLVVMVVVVVLPLSVMVMV